MNSVLLSCTRRSRRMAHREAEVRWVVLHYPLD